MITWRTVLLGVACVLWPLLAFLEGPWLLLPSLGLLVVAGLGAWRGEWLLAQLGLAAGLMASGSLFGLPVVGPAMGLGAVGLLVWRVPAARASALAWWRRGRMGVPELLMALGFAGVASTALLGWVWLAEPDLSDLLEQIPPWSPVSIALLGTLLAVANALVEELAFRGILQQALEREWGWAVALVVQAVVFGLMHFQGFPRGWMGVGLATVYGLMMGILRVRSRGLAVPFGAHVLADATIFAILAGMAA